MNDLELHGMNTPMNDLNILNKAIKAIDTVSHEHVAHYRDEGYLWPVSVMSHGAAAGFRSKLEAHELQHGALTGAQRHNPHLLFTWVDELVSHPKILDAVEKLIGPNILVRGSSFFIKEPNDPRFVSWHQDSAYFGVTPSREITAWVAFTDSNETNGCVRVMPGTHREAALSHVEKMEDNNMLARGQTIEGLDEKKAVNLVLKAGEFSLHHERTAHASLANDSNDRRIGLAFFYIPTEVRSESTRRGALLVRGNDRHNHWDVDPLPRYDLDPICVAELDRIWGKYRKGEYKAH